MQTKRLFRFIPVLWALSLTWRFSRAAINEPSEFLHSFLSRSQLLENSSTRQEPLLKHHNVLAVSVYVENWSDYKLVYSGHSVTAGSLDTSFPPRNMAEKKRGFALRNVGLEGRSTKSHRTAGMIGWTLLGATDGIKVSKLSVAWNVSLDRPEIAVALGDFVPQFDKMWENRHAGRLVSETANQVDILLKLADSRTTVAARIKRAPPQQGKRHYKLIITIVPQRVDVWGWVKYFQEGAKERVSSSVPTLPSSTSSLSHERTSSAAKANNDKLLLQDEEMKTKPIYHRKELLKPGPTLTKLEDQGFRNLRDTMSTQVATEVAMGLQVENWSRFSLNVASVEINSGKMLPSSPPGRIDPGKQDVSVVTSKSGMTGTSGVMRWKIGSGPNAPLMSVMWSVPYNPQFYSTWSAVSLTPASKTPPTFDQLYSKKDPSRFIRVKAGREFEFSDGHFILMAFMDADTSKPVFRVGVVPTDEKDIASSIRKQLKLPILRRDDIRLTDKRENQQPQIGLVQTSSATKVATSQLFAIIMSTLSSLRLICHRLQL